MPPALLLDLLRRANVAWLTTLGSLPEAEYAVPSLLPGWTRGHVAAHLALNADALARALRGAVDGAPMPMYDSSEARDRDIEALAVTGPETLRKRNREAGDEFERAWASLPEELRTDDLAIERTPGGPSFGVGSCLGRRLCEVEIHHADLGAGWSHGDWSEEFATWLVDQRAARVTEVRFEATDTGRVWPADDATTTVSGTSGALAWWLTGRGSGEGLACDSGQLPAQPAF